eukprot:COSAG02_NODE_29_length_51136_cov_346.293317_2_plen_697_part_00
MDIGCFQVRRVLQDVEQRVQERARNKETERFRWQRTAEKKKAEANSRRTDLRGQVGKRFQTLERKQCLDQGTQLAPSTVGVPTAREQAGFVLLAQLLVEAGEQGRALLSAAAGLSKAAAGQAEPLALADALCARCEGLSELVLDLTDELTAEVMGIRPAAAEEHCAPQLAPNLEGDVAREWTPPASTSRQHTLVRTTTLTAHPFADAETLEYMLDQLLAMVSSAASLATQSRCVQPDTKQGRPATNSPLMKDQSDGEQSAGHPADSSSKSAEKSWKLLKAKRKVSNISNETVAQVAPILLKHGLMDFARQLKKYGFHRLPALRKATVGQLVQLGMSSMQATTLLRAVTGNGTMGQAEAGGGRRSVTKRAHGVEISNEAWFYKAELEPEPEQHPVTMADLRPVSRRPSLPARPVHGLVHGEKNAAIQSLVCNPGFDRMTKRVDDNADANDETAKRTGTPDQQTDTEFVEGEIKRAEQQRNEEAAEPKASIKRSGLAKQKELREEQEANDWLRARPAGHRAIVRDSEKAMKDATVKNTLRKVTQPPHLHGISNDLHSNRKPPKDRTGSELSIDSPAIGTIAAMRFSASSKSFGGQVYESQSSQQELVELDNEIFFWKTKTPRTSQVYVGDPRFLPTAGTVRGSAAQASFTGGKFIERWSSLQAHSPETIESRKQALRVAKAWQPKTTRSFRVERVLGA